MVLTCFRSLIVSARVGAGWCDLYVWKDRKKHVSTHVLVSSRRCVYRARRPCKVDLLATSLFIAVFPNEQLTYRGREIEGSACGEAWNVCAIGTVSTPDRWIGKSSDVQLGFSSDLSFEASGDPSTVGLDLSLHFSSVDPPLGAMAGRALGVQS